VLTKTFFCGVAVKYEARLDDGTLVAKSDGVEFTVKEGQCKQILSVFFSPILNFSVWDVLHISLQCDRSFLSCIVKGC
jgi:hypothetical protein